MLGAGLRVGWLLAPPAWLHRFSSRGLFRSGGCANQIAAHDIDPQQTVEFVRQVLNRHEADLTDLEVHRPTLEDAYLKLIGGMPGEANSK